MMGKRSVGKEGNEMKQKGRGIKEGGFLRGRGARKREGARRGIRGVTREVKGGEILRERGGEGEER